MQEVCYKTMQMSNTFVPRAVSRKLSHQSSRNTQLVSSANSQGVSTFRPSQVPEKSDTRYVVSSEPETENLSKQLKDNEGSSISNQFFMSNCESKENVERTSEPQSQILKAIKSQEDAPYVNVGSLSSRRRVPFYVRKYQPIPLQVPQRNSCAHPLGARSYCSSQSIMKSSIDMQSPVSVLDRDLCNWHPRRWDFTGFGMHYQRGSIRRRGVDFTVMSYNILAQNLLEDNLYHLYGHCQSEVLEWDYRKHRLLQELLYHRPDVICLQEVQETHYSNYFYPELNKQGYEGHYIKRTGSNKLDGCATFYNTSKFQLDSCVTVPYFREQGGSVLNRDNVALILGLRPHSRYGHTNKTLCVANTHLLFNPRRGDVKLAQLMILLAELDKCACISHDHRYSYNPLIMCGDFNTEPHSEICKLLLMAELKYEGLLCRHISGQEEGFRSGGYHRLSRDFLPRSVGIGDRCQYIHSSSGSKGERRSEEREGRLHQGQTQGSGLLKHDFCLSSVYEPTVERRKRRYRAITTHHSKASCTVDYILYGVNRKEQRIHHGEIQTRNVREGSLNLIGKYGLLTDRELKNLGSLPNERFSSDHLCLVARFLLNL